MRIVKNAQAGQQKAGRVVGARDREIYHSEFNNLFAEQLATYDLEAVVPITYAEAQTAITNSTLVTGTHYKLSDKADGGIILLAVTPSKFSLEGQGIFLNPDFQDIGALSGSMDGVWYAGGEAGYTNSEVVIWDGLHYQVIEDTAFDGTNPATNSLLPVPAYIVLPKTILNGYIEEVDFILYDFANDSIFERHDKRGNKWNPSYITSFQAGNDQTLGNIVAYQSDVDIINQRGLITNNNFAGTNNGYLVADNNFTGFFRNNHLENTSITVEGTATIESCNIQLTSGSIIFETGVLHQNKTINDLGSTFEADLDMTDGDDYDAGTDTLTIPANLNYVGIFNLTDCSAQPILKIVNLPSVGEVEFMVADAADTVVFTNTAIGLAVADNLVADVVGVNTLTGRTNGNDFIRYRKSGNLNVRTTGSIMA